MPLSLIKKNVNCLNMKITVYRVVETRTCRSRGTVKRGGASACLKLKVFRLVLLGCDNHFILC